MDDADIDLSEVPEVAREKLEDAKIRFNLEDVPEGKTRVTMYLDNAIVQYFKMRAGTRGYQTLINETLRKVIRRHDLEALIRRIVREELSESKRKRA